MKELTAVVLVAYLALIHAFQSLPTPCILRSTKLAWQFKPTSPTGLLRSTKGSHEDTGPERARSPMEPTSVVVERGVALDVGSTFFRAESCLSRDLSVLAAYLYKVSPSNCYLLTS